MKIHRNKKTAGFRSKGKKGIKIIGKWKPVSLDPSLFPDEKLEEIVCFEELTDYKLVKSSKELIKKGLKRKHDGEDTGEGDEDEEQMTKSKKKRKKRKDKFESKHESEEADDDCEDLLLHEDESEGLVVSEDEPLDTGSVKSEDENAEEIIEPNEQPKGKKKKKRRKSKKTAAKATGNPPAPTSAKKLKNWAASDAAGSSGKNADVSAWKDLFVPELVLQALSYLGFSSPTPIQALVLPPAIRDKMDILGAAETGSGKTLAFAIPMIHSILEWQKNKDADGDEEKTNDSSDGDGQGPAEVPETEENQKTDHGEGDESSQDDDEDDDDDELGCVKVVEDVDINFNPAPPTNAPAWDKSRPLLGLVVAPTRELAVQVKHHIDAVARFTGIKTAIIVGGMAAQKQERVLNRRPEIVIATPGRVWELIKEKHPHLSNLRQLRCLVVDEADRMVEKGHYAELSQLLELLSDVHFNPKRQTFVFSATLTLIHQAPTRLLQKKNFKKMDKDSKLESLMRKIGMKSKPKVIDLTRKQATVETLTETKIHCTNDEKDFYLYYFLLQYTGRTMVFANSIDCIKRLCSLLTILDCNPLTLHANMHQKQRLKNLERFAERESCILLTTDVAARGLDIPNIQHVLHYQVPRTSETYVHRSGRTARASSDGLSLLLIGPDDVLNFKKICRTLNKNEDLPFFPVDGKCMNGIKERVNLARQIEKMEYFNSKAKHQKSWIQQAAEALEIDLDDDDELIGGKQNEEEDREKEKAVKAMKKQLKRLLSQPVFRNIIKTKYPTQSGKLTLPTLLTSKAESALQTISKQNSKETTKKKKRKGAGAV
ncbi:ATP-dependent RNA helicase DDX24 [Spea bombifrons]|uniref:ATP-dependent RNA helicase DDX24 n=1 Tax=Spea bombifrons TaxID=233779 RepID=UPI002349E1B4|nr:ATP-dependent RNA helicase DDX24 [Spea bombifrons]XP_053331656.1 ATP-dependent RNA helicase DDX24 [Spea bombifrons]